MSHPHEYLLQEYKLSIDRLVPLTPQEIVDEATALYNQLMADEHASERQIKQALILIGRKEYPYRKAYVELCAGDEEKRLQEAAISKLEPGILAKIKSVLDSGVHITDYVNSKFFEKDLLPEERFRVEEAILSAHDVINKQCGDRAHERQANYDELVARYKKQAEKMQALIDQLRSMAARDPKWNAEIQGKADEFEEGWSIVERDPTEEEIIKEIENWTGVFEEDGGEEIG